MLDPAAWDVAEFTKPRPGRVDPKTCPACARVKSLGIEAAESGDPELAADWVELAYAHAELGHPWDHRWPGVDS
ncbi:hypothetical protein [Streptomyces sp. WM6378]|uniref:hypothetical protein n=1 Tax=Streptomyces sp. WM6378 TaxID=1415557 RepID=UPI0006AFBB86|nr:hypothetical protein [Streptomyces sp. WM6378]KOU53143.1 hypothetical protein ADK54_05420 [Streptomyces sp. WM6378]